MGKQTVIIYSCDICGKEFKEELLTCDRCKKDYCIDCSALLTIEAYMTTKDFKLDYIVYHEDMCLNCSKDIKTIKLNDDREKGEFKIAFSD